MSLHDTIKGAVRTDSPSVTLDDTLETALRVMTAANFTAVLVMTGNEVAGIITDLDFMCCVANDFDFRTARVSDVMTACQMITTKSAKNPCVQLDEDEDVRMALAIMNEAGVHHLLVGGASGKVIGLVSALDLLKRLAA